MENVLGFIFILGCLLVFSSKYNLFTTIITLGVITIINWTIIQVWAFPFAVVIFAIELYILIRLIIMGILTITMNKYNYIINVIVYVVLCVIGLFISGNTGDLLYNIIVRTIIGFIMIKVLYKVNDYAEPKYVAVSGIAIEYILVFIIDKILMIFK